MTKQSPVLMQVLSDITDNRQARGKRHSLSAILALSIAAMLCGYRSYSAMAEWGRGLWSAIPRGTRLYKR